MPASLEPQQRRGYVFVSSERPDPYINAVCAMTKEYKDIRITFVGVKDPQAMPLGEIASSIRKMMNSLASGRYTTRTREGREVTRTIPSCDIYIEAARVLSDSREDLVIPREEMDSCLKGFHRRGPAIFDVTAFQKDLLVDLVSLLVAQGVGNVRYFHGKKSPVYDENDLIHSLGVAEYEYVDLAKSKNVQKSVARIGRGSKSYRISLGVLTVAAVSGGGAILWGTNSPFIDVFGITASSLSLGGIALNVIDWRER